jgi:hypothetical protein
VEIAVSYVPGGAATALFEGLPIGGSVDASGPFGRFCLLPNDANRRYLLIATGTGVTPYRAMLPLLASLIAARGIEVVLLQGARTPEELLYGDEFRAFANAQPRFRFVPCFSRELPAAASPHAHADVRHGYVQQRWRVRAGCRGRHRLPVRQPEHGRCLLRGAEGARPADPADPPREVRQQQVGRRRIPGHALRARRSSGRAACRAIARPHPPREVRQQQVNRQAYAGACYPA